MGTHYRKISVNIPLIVGGSVKTVFRSLKNVSYPKNKIEIIIVEGNHIAKQRNVALKYSSGDIVYLLDDDSRVTKNCLKIINHEFINPNVAAVGGPSLQNDRTSKHFQKLVNYSLETYFGAMRMKFRYSQQSGYKGTEYNLLGANLALRKGVVLKLGGFNNKIVPNEETELLRRVKASGYKLIYNKNLIIHRGQRKNLSELVKQFQHYGRGRMKQILHSFNPEDFIFAIPVIFILYLVSSIFIHNPRYWLVFLLYILAGLATSIKASIKHKNIKLIYQLLLIFPIIHISYGLGLVMEFIDFVKNKRLIIRNGRAKCVKIFTGYDLLNYSYYSDLSGKNNSTPYVAKKTINYSGNNVIIKSTQRKPHTM